jgi:hypothetical protein
MASKNRRNKVKFKLQPELIVIVACLVIMLVATIIMAVPTKAEKTTTSLNNAIYTYNQNNSSSSTGSSSSSSSSYLPNKNVFEEVSHSALVKKIRTEEYVYVIYGQYTSNQTIVGNLYNIQTICEDEKINKVYLYDSTWVDTYDDVASESFNNLAKTLQDQIDNNKSADVVGFDLLESPALLVFHNGSMVFNSQSYDNDSYTWSMYIQKAFYLSEVK